MSTTTTAKTRARTEDGSDFAWDNTQVVHAARRWSPKRVAPKPADQLDVGDYVETARGWSSIASLTRD